MIIEEVDAELSSLRYNYMYKFLCDDDFSIEIIAYKSFNSRKLKSDIITCSIYSSGDSIADIYYNPIKDTYDLKIIKPYIGKNITRLVLDKIKIYLDNISHELSEIFYYETTSFIAAK